jgi:hypothetical protein
MKKRYLIAILGSETGSLSPMPYYGFRSVHRAHAEADKLNSRRSDDLTCYVVYDRRRKAIAPGP